MENPQIQLSIDLMVVMDAFCWSYANALLQKLKELKQQNRVFEKGDKLTKIAHAVTHALYHQIDLGIAPNINREELDIMIRDAEEYLSIFHKK